MTIIEKQSGRHWDSLSKTVSQLDTRVLGVPELPEVETVRRGLDQLVVGRRIGGFEVLEAKTFRIEPPLTTERGLVGATVLAARRRGKVLVLDLSGQVSLVGHLKMTGQMVVVGPKQADQSGQRWGAGHPTDSLIGQMPDRSTRLIITFDDGTKLYFNDQRKFGWLHLMPTNQVEALDLIAKMGPEPLEGEPWPEFASRARRHKSTTVKAVLLNQEVVAGIGNIYADEACWIARVHPATPVQRLSDRKLKALLEGAIASMQQSLELGGSTDRNYVDAQGRRGSYLAFAKVFRKDGQPCERCGATLAKTRVAGRGTHFCPRCQRLPK
ncbi:MAG: bifunctional DNA-formamidopyrimidine glycosylase/DNA-(apurinic or apyrimidinic site) lyase [Micrococcales bacterium]|nr:bifunctional DNA-formamidopyrimidine glycosylase/DNA-(apurinic or apyrimidinic site) lyase [Micrococcales bacterium]